MKYKFIVTLLALVIGQPLFAQNLDTVHVGHSLERYSRLKDNTFSYSVFAERNGTKTPENIIRASSFEKKFGKRSYLVIKHDVEGSNGMGKFLAILEKITLRPIAHIRNTRNNEVEAFEFNSELITSLDSVENNKASDFKMELPFPVYNFEVDLEFYSCLPLKKEAKFIIPFYHAGSKKTPPNYYKLIVEKEEKIDVDGLGAIDTWVLFMDYHGQQPTRFWYAKENQQFIKMEASFKGGKFIKKAIF